MVGVDSDRVPVALRRAFGRRSSLPVPIITVGTHRLKPGRTVVYWHLATSNGDASEAILKADKRGAFLHVDHQGEVPPEWIAQAEQAAAQLADDPGADMSHLLQPAR